MCELLFLFVLVLDYLGLLGLFALRLEDGFLNLTLLVGTLLIHRVVVLGNHALLLILHLVVVDFLHKSKGTRNVIETTVLAVILIKKERRTD